MFYFGSMAPFKWKPQGLFQTFSSIHWNFLMNFSSPPLHPPIVLFPHFPSPFLMTRLGNPGFCILTFNAYHSSDPDALGLIVHSLVSNHDLEIINALSSASTRCWTWLHLPMPSARSSSAFPYGSFLCSPWAEVLGLLTASFSPRTWETAVSQVWQCFNYGPLGADLSFFHLDPLAIDPAHFKTWHPCPIPTKCL